MFLCRHAELVSASKKSGFTLIELLVVVLIIGILAAVALPQYKKAVMRVDVMQVKLVLDQIKKAQSIYKAANGSYAFDLEALDIGFPNVVKENNNAWQYDINNRRIGLTRIQLNSGGVNFTNWGVGFDGLMRYDGNITCYNFRGADYKYADYACRLFKGEQ